MYDVLSIENLENIRDIVVYNFNNNLSLSPDYLESIIVITKNTIQNIVRYGDPSRDKIILSTNPLYQIGDKNTFTISVKTYGKLGNEMLEKIGIVPILDKNGKLHFGMFLVGMLARILGGSMLVGRNTNKPYHTIEIRIPVSGG